MNSSQQAAGWYEDAEAPGMVRWWDGAAWGDMTMPKDMAPKQASTSERFAAAAGGAAKLWFLLLFVVICLLLLYVVV